jgi:DNA-binding response OmpR family regulator
VSADAPRGLVMVIEDQAAIAEVVRLNLVKAGFGVHVEAAGDTGLAAVRRLKPVAIILDVGLPGLDGIEVCRRLRAEQNWTPVLFVSARDDEIDRILGLELGADDYITKPFSPRELVARVGGVLRRTQGIAVGGALPLTAGVVRVEVDSHRVFVGDDEIPLQRRSLTCSRS